MAEGESLPPSTPPQAAWLRIAAEEAQRSGLRLAGVLGGSKQRPYVYARWRAWQRLQDEFPRASLAGMGRTTGFDHSSVRWGLMRVSGGDPALAAPRIRQIAQFLPRPLQRPIPIRPTL